MGPCQTLNLNEHVKENTRRRGGGERDIKGAGGVKQRGGGEEVAMGTLKRGRWIRW